MSGFCSKKKEEDSRGGQGGRVTGGCFQRSYDVDKFNSTDWGEGSPGRDVGVTGHTCPATSNYTGEDCSLLGKGIPLVVEKPVNTEAAAVGHFPTLSGQSAEISCSRERSKGVKLVTGRPLWAIHLNLFATLYKTPIGSAQNNLADLPGEGAGGTVGCGR